ncbi:MAG: hypothetical protein GDA46_02755 [Bdellovibrionales bacterium]|nr:hypothetical protein [Bdellovibrionales bacterium]
MSKLINKIFFLLAVQFFVTSCLFFQSKSIKEEESISRECSAGNASFIAEQIQTSPNDQAITIEYKEGLADSFILNLRVCLKEAIRPDTSIQNSSFTVSYKSNLTGKEETIEVISDSNGCIQWQEEYKYKYTLNSVWIGLERTIKNKDGTHRGAVKILTAVNPWLSSNEKSEGGKPQILDMRCEFSKNHFLLKDSNSKEDSKNKRYYEKGLKFLKTADKQKPLLWVPKFSMQIEEITDQKASHQENSTEQIQLKNLLKKYVTLCRPGKDKNCYKRKFRFNFRFPLKFKSVDSIISFDKELNGGVYNFRSFLVVKPKEDNKNYNIAKCEKEDLEIDETGDLSFHCDFNITAFDSNSVFKIVYEISSVNSTNPKEENYLPMRHFQGVHTFQFDFGSDLKSTIIDANDNKEYSTVLKNPKEEIDLMKNFPQSLSEINENSAISLKALQLSPKGEFKYANIQPGENIIEREVSFVGTLCMKDDLNSQKLQDAKFRVFLQKPRELACQEGENDEIFPGKIEEIFYEGKKRFIADANCITVSIPIKHRIYDKQRYFEIIVHVLSEELNLYGQVRLALNPWQRAFQAFQDAQNLDEKHIRFDVDGVKPPELVINQFRSINLFPSYGIDKLLKIHLFHRFYLLFQPFIRRPDNVSLGLNYQSRELLRDGHHLIRVLILRNPKETGVISPVRSQKKLNHSRKNTTGKEITNLPYEDFDYITHTDSVVETKANFVNFYMPIYLSTKQLYYTASRNLIMIQIYPADPKYVILKEDGSIDTEKTKWIAFNDHDLINKPYIGVINIQNWTNWNLLQPRVVNTNTDEIINSSEIGKKYKRFDFSNVYQKNNSFVKSCSENSTEEVSTLNEKRILQPISNCVEYANSKTIRSMNDVKRKRESEIQKELGITFEEIRGTNEIISYDTEKQKEIENILAPNVSKENSLLDEAFQENFSGKTQKACEREHEISLNPGLEAYKDEVESSDDIPNLLQNFSLENSLKPVTIDDSNETGAFIEDLKASYDKYLQFLKPTFEDSFSIVSKHIDLLSGETHCDEDDKMCLDIYKAYFSILKEFSNSKNYFSSVANFIKENQDVFGNLDRNLDDMKNQEILDFIIEKVIPNLKFSDGENFIKTQTFVFMLLFLLPESEIHKFLKKIKSPYSVEDMLKISLWPIKYSDPTSYLKKLKEFLLENKDTILQNAERNNVIENSLKNDTHELSKADNKRFYQNLKNEFFLDSSEIAENLKDLINNGLTSESIKNIKNLPFLKSLCFFWFEKFPKYLNEEIKFSTYTNYMRNYDIYQALEHTYVKNDIEIESLINSLIDLEKIMSNDSGEKRCHSNYRKCASEAFCTGKSFDKDSYWKNNYCKPTESKNEFCELFIKEICSKEENQNLDLCKNDSSQNCLERINHTCRLNPDKDFCENQNICFSGYNSCLKESSLFGTEFSNIIDNYQEPLQTCVNNFKEFFKVENKMIIYDISHEDKNFKYKGGYLKNFGFSSNNSIGSYMNWTAQRGRNLSISADSKFSSFINFFTFGVSSSLSQNQSSNESNSSRIAWDTRAGEAVFLSVGVAEIEIGVKEYQKCLVIKPRPNSFVASLKTGKPEYYENVWKDSTQFLDEVVFSRSGLILCNPRRLEEGSPDLEKITESYYYISQANTTPENSQFLDLYDLANRPFLLILRGEREYRRFYSLARKFDPDVPLNETSINQFIEPVDIGRHSKNLNLKLREMNGTGFHPGVYDFPYNLNEEIGADDFRINLEDDSTLHSLHSFDLFKTPNIKNTTTPINN